MTSSALSVRTCARIATRRWRRLSVRMYARVATLEVAHRTLASRLSVCTCARVATKNNYGSDGGKLLSVRTCVRVATIKTFPRSWESYSQSAYAYELQRQLCTYALLSRLHSLCALHSYVSYSYSASRMPLPDSHTFSVRTLP